MIAFIILVYIHLYDNMEMPYFKFLTSQLLNNMPLSFIFTILSIQSQHHEAASIKVVSIYFVYEKSFLETTLTLRFLTLEQEKESLLWA